MQIEMFDAKLCSDFFWRQLVDPWEVKDDFTIKMKTLRLDRFSPYTRTEHENADDDDDDEKHWRQNNEKSFIKPIQTFTKQFQSWRLQPSVYSWNVYTYWWRSMNHGVSFPPKQSHLQEYNTTNSCWVLLLPWQQMCYHCHSNTITSINVER